MSENNYSAKDLSVLKDLEPVRKRPAMYIDSTDKVGMHHLVWEIVDNAVDESLAGHCSEIEVNLNPDGYPEKSISVKDNGRGMPVDIHPTEGISGIEIIFTKLHGGGKFNNSNYKTSGGLHGVGASVTNALSEFLDVIVVREGKKYKQSFSRGLSTTDLLTIDENCNEDNGTMVVFKPDPEIFKGALEECNLEFDGSLIKNRLKYTALLNRKLKLVFSSNEEKQTFYSEDGIVDIVREEIKNPEKVLSDDILFLENETKSNDDFGQFMSMEFAFAVESENYENYIKTFVNNITTKNGGRHLMGFRNAIKKVVTDYAKKELSVHESLEIEDILEGCTSIISLRMENPEYGGQTKSSLTSTEAQSYVYSTLKEFFSDYFEKNPDFAKKFVQKTILAKAAREKSEKMKTQTRKELNSNPLGALPGKLAHCINKDPNFAEIFIVEGDSAGGSAKQGRDRNFQAILPLKGKILNTQKADDKKILNSQEVKNLVIALGTDFGANFDIEKLKYKKIVLLMDADVDGAHIAILILTLFNNKLRELIERGYVYMAKPPLYVAKSKKGNSKKYFLDDNELKEEYPNGIPNSVEVSRFKGLGEMGPEELWETTMNPETRFLERVTIDDSELADKMINDLMGDIVEPRKTYLEEHAEEADLDI